MTHVMSVAIFIVSGTAFSLDSPNGGLLVFSIMKHFVPMESVHRWAGKALQGVLQSKLKCARSYPLTAAAHAQKPHC